MEKIKKSNVDIPAADYICVMFVLEFFSIVRKVLSWAEPSVCHYANEHEMHLMNKTSSFHGSCLEELRNTSRELVVLHMYVKNTYPIYFGVKLRMGGAPMRDYHTTTTRSMMTSAF